jgi:hypothetical protein
MSFIIFVFILLLLLKLNLAESLPYKFRAQNVFLKLKKHFEFF